MGLFGSSSPFDPLLDKACNEQNTNEDWSLILSICDKAKASPKNSKDCLASIIKKMQHKVPRVALQALLLLDACVSNSGREFQKNVSSQDFINEMRPLVGRSDLVGEKIRELIQKWTNDFQDDAELSLIVSFYHYLRASGAHFPVKNETERVIKPPNPDSVDSQKEADDIAIAIQRSLQEDEKKAAKKNEPQSLYYSQLQSAPNTKPEVTVCALYDFEAAEENELTFHAGDIITLIEESDPNWWEGSLNGRSGLFPANFVTKEVKRDTSNTDIVQTQKQTVNKKIVITVDETLLDATLDAVESADPGLLDDPQEMIDNEHRCSKMGAIIDARLSDMDREQLELTQLNQKLLQCLQLYDSLMQQQFPQQPQLHNPQMANYITPQPMTQQMGGMNLQGVPSGGMYHQGDYQNAPGQQIPQGATPMSQPMMSQPNHYAPHYAMPHQPMQQQQQLPPQPMQQQQHAPNGMPPGQMVQNQNQYHYQQTSYEPTAPPPTPPVTETQPPPPQQLL